jgi:YVTN family beta-propeller protein
MSRAGFVAVNPKTNTIYATGPFNTVPVINGQTNTVTATIPTSATPEGVAVNPKTNTVYVAIPKLRRPAGGCVSCPVGGCEVRA